MYRQFRGQLDVVMRQEYRAGEKCFVDYSGDGIPIVDPETGEVSEAPLFVATYARVPRLLHALHIARADGSYIKELSRPAKTEVLVLDDLGLSPIGDQERRDLLEVLEDRHGVRSTIVTSQIPVKKWHETLGDPTIADAFLDRLLNRAHRIELKPGPSLRLKVKKGTKAN